MKIAILDDYQNAVRTLSCYTKLAEHEVTIFHDRLDDVDALAQRLLSFEALVLIRERTRISSALLERLPHLKLISQTGKVSQHLDLAACTAHRVAVAESAGSPYAPAELTWALVLAGRRFIAQEAARMKLGQWQTTFGFLLRGSTLGVWGYGKIGRIVAAYGQAFGMSVSIWGREASRAMATKDGYRVAASKEDFFAQCDVLSLHLRLHEDTRGIVKASDLAYMKADSLLVNTSRAELIEPHALVCALERGRPGYAALDVFESEPLPADNPLLRMNNVLCTPHLGYVERNSYELYFGAAFDNILAFASGQSTHIVNPQARAR